MESDGHLQQLRRYATVGMGERATMDGTLDSEIPSSPGQHRDEFGDGALSGDEDLDGDGLMDGSGREPKAKKRRKYINKACDNCRTRHSRCDGKEPCAPCAKKGFQCTYSAPPSRRGPVSERQLQELITSLTKQIESEKKMKKDWKDKFYPKAGGASSPPSGAAPFSPASDGEAVSDSPSGHVAEDSSSYSGHGTTTTTTSGTSWAGPSGQESLIQTSNLSMYVDAYRRYISRHISAHPSVFEPGAAQKVVTSNPRTPLAFQMYTVLANGARVMGNQPASMEFAMTARRTLGAVFDQTDSLVAQGLMILAYYMSGQAEADKTMYYLQLARKMCQHLDTRSSDYYMLILMTIGIASPHHEEKLEVFTELKMRLEPLLSSTITASSVSLLGRNFTLTLAITAVQVELEMAKLRMDYNADYAVMLQVLEKFESMLAEDKSTNYSKLGFRILFEVIRAQCYCALGLREMAVECTNQVSELCKHPDFPYVPVMVLNGVEMMAMIQLEEGRIEQVREHIQRLSKTASTYPCVRLIAQKLHDALQVKATKNYDPRSLDHARADEHAPGPMSHMGGPQAFGQSTSLFPGQERPGSTGAGTQRRAVAADMGGNGASAQMGMHERGLSFPGGQEPLGLGGMGTRGGLEGLSGMDSRLMQERGYPKSDHLASGGYEGMGGRMVGMPHPGERGTMEEFLSRERAMGMGGPMPHHLAYNDQLQRQDIDYRMQQEHAGLFDRRPLHPQGLPQSHQSPHLHPYGSLPLHRGGGPGPSASSLYGGGGMADMGGLPPLGALPGRGMTGMPGFSGGMGAGGNHFSSMPPAAQQQMRGGQWGGMSGMPPHYGGGQQTGGPEPELGGGGSRHHLPPPHQQPYMMYGSEQDE